MSGSRRWLRAVQAKACEVCGEQMTEFAIRELNFRLVPKHDGRGHSAVETKMTLHCPTCGNAYEEVAHNLKPIDMKSGVGWLVDRTRKITDSLAADEEDAWNFSEEPEAKEHGPTVADQDDDDCTCEFDVPGHSGDDDAGHRSGSESHTNDEEIGPSDKAPNKPLEPSNRGRILTQPSIRSCCPADPITTGGLNSVRRSLRCYSDVRTASSFHRFMMLFGVAVHCKTGDPIEEEGTDD